MNLIEGIKGNRFVVFGRAGMDMFAEPIGTKSEIAESFQSDLGGSSANICAGLCKLGSKASLVTSVSDDAIGRFCVNRLKYYGVGTEYVKSVAGEFRTSLAIYESCIDNFQNVIYRNGAADFEVKPSEMDEVNYSQFTALITAGTVFAGQPSRDATFRAFENARAQGIPIIFDIDYRPYSWPSPQVASEVLSRAGEESDMIVGNDEEFGFMAGGIDKGLDKARDLASRGNRLVIYKMGEEGAITLYNNEEIKTGIFPTEAIKPVGAGDSFMAGLLSSLASGYDLKNSVIRGSACASIVVSLPGCAPAMPDEDQLNNFINNSLIKDL
ncbi:5-dehydro-2-deoxygluconokinase [Paracoccaceae bacterium]|nr:5-dehydro-2-deoxygluconokinase [Paracoccaceae bacterium]